MQILAVIKWLTAAHPSGLCPGFGGVAAAYSGTQALSLPFSPVKLVVLTAWVYLCLYCVQRVQLTPLVPKSRKGLTNLATLLLGPIVLLVLLVLDIYKTPADERGGIFIMITERLRKMSDRVRSAGLVGSGHPTIKLLDSSGAELRQIYGHGKSTHQDSHILKLTKEIISEALQGRASDILIDPKTDSIYTIRYRIDGVLREVRQMNTTTCQAVVNSIKAVSSMDIAEKRRPQDGAFLAKMNEDSASFRVASAGVLNGEKLSIRVLNQNAGMFKLDNIGLTEKQRNIIKNVVSKPSGMILLCGPTGSGKTTTLYAMLNSIDFYTRNVITVEDPIEYVLANTSQIEVNPRADITFAKSLRSILRQDPDVICVGEIRDEETAKIALQASQTGHLVLATIHSSSTASAFIRLLDLGVSPLLLSSGLSVVVSQRLVRRLCKFCKAPAQLSSRQIRDFKKRNINYANMKQAVGCDYCLETGYYGRTAIYDILVLDDDIKANIANSTLSITRLRREGDQRGKSNLQKQGLLRVVSGITSIEELSRVLG